MAPFAGWHVEEMLAAARRVGCRPYAEQVSGNPQPSHRLIAWPAVLDVDIEHAEDHAADKPDIEIRLFPPPTLDEPSVGAGIILAVQCRGLTLARQQGMHRDSGTGVEVRRVGQRHGVELR
jgi:hypothetical protein